MPAEVHSGAGTKGTENRKKERATEDGKPEARARDERHSRESKPETEEGTCKGSAKGRKTRKAKTQKCGKDKSASAERKGSASSCESGREEAITAAWEG